MKINSTKPTNPVAEARSHGRRGTERSGGARKGDVVSLSADAHFIQSLRDEAQAHGGIREGVVAETRAALDAGTFEADIDMDSVVDALLADL